MSPVSFNLVKKKKRDADRARNAQRSRPLYAQRRQERLPDQRLRWATLRGGTLWEAQCSTALHTPDLLVSPRRTARSERSSPPGHPCRLANISTKVVYQEQRRQRRPLPQDEAALAEEVGRRAVAQGSDDARPHSSGEHQRCGANRSASKMSGISPRKKSSSRTPLQRRRVTNGTDTKRRHLPEGKVFTANRAGL